MIFLSNYQLFHLSQENRFLNNISEEKEEIEHAHENSFIMVPSADLSVCLMNYSAWYYAFSLSELPVASLHLSLPLFSLHMSLSLHMVQV